MLIVIKHLLECQRVLRQIPQHLLLRIGAGAEIGAVNRGVPAQLARQIESVTQRYRAVGAKRPWRGRAAILFVCFLLRLLV